MDSLDSVGRGHDVVVGFDVAVMLDKVQQDLLSHRVLIKHPNINIKV